MLHVYVLPWVIASNRCRFVAAERRREEERLKQLQELEKAAVVDPESYDKLQSEIEADKERRASMVKHPNLW